MRKIEKIKKYIDKHGAPRNLRYDSSMKEVFALASEMGTIEAISLAFVYGKAKGYKQAQAEGVKQHG